MIHTPIQKLEFPNDRGVRLYCKREDLLPFSLGGNKVRIGRAFFRDMQEKNKDCMIIYGNSRSNLCRVLANLCCAEKIPCYMICSSEENEEPTDRNKQQPSDEMARSRSHSVQKNRDCTDRRADDEPFDRRGISPILYFRG